MPPTTTLHSHPNLQNLSLLLLSAIFFPLLTILALLSLFISPWLASTKHINHTRRWRSISSSTFRPRTILVTNLRTPESLSLARTFYGAGHRVIGADYEEYYFPIPAHFSRAVEVFYRLGSKEGKLGRERYVRDLVDVVRKEKVELWVNCEGGNADGEVKEVLERETRCKVLQFGSEVMKLLEDEDAFGKRLKNLGLNILEQHRITSEEEALAILYPERAEPGPGKQYIIKSASPADLTSSEMALLPLSSQDDTKASIKALSPSRSRPLILQEFIPDHQHYTTQAHIINSKPGAFVAYPTSTTLLTPLPSSSLLSQILLKYTTLLTSSLSSSTSNTKQITGHLNLLFSLPSPLALSAESRFGAPSSTSASFLSNIHLISCTPTLSLGTLAFRDASEDLASAYLSILPDHEPKGIANGHKEERIVVPRPGVRGYYSFGNEAVRLVLLPIWGLLRWQVGVRELLRWWIEFLEYVVGWRECWWEVWDPWVVWWRYGGYVVGKGLIGLWERRWGTEDE